MKGLDDKEGIKNKESQLSTKYQNTNLMNLAITLAKSAGQLQTIEFRESRTPVIAGHIVGGQW